MPSVNETFGSEQPGASVTIEGVKAAYNATSGRYEADPPLDVQWNKKVDYSVDLDGVKVNDSMSVTMFSSSQHARVAEWWNGWDWVSVFGEDDCSGPGSALATYAGFNHPLTAYVMVAVGKLLRHPGDAVGDRPPQPPRLGYVRPEDLERGREHGLPGYGLPRFLLFGWPCREHHPHRGRCNPEWAKGPK